MIKISWRSINIINYMNNVLNFKMLKLFIGEISSGYKLNSTLWELLSEGFIIYEGRYFLKSLYKHQSHIDESDFTDSTGHECFINSIHLDDYVNGDFLQEALLFSWELIKLWNNKNSELKLIFILSETDFGFNLKFHLYRENEDWINVNDVYKFEESLMVFNSCC